MIMSQRLLFRRDGKLPSIDLRSWRDNSQNREIGHYFALEESNATKKAKKRLLKALQESPKWKKMMDHTGDDLSFNLALRESYEYWDIRLRRILVLLISFTCGLSGRGKEMTSFKYMNTDTGDRHFLMVDGQFMAISEYHKSQAIMDSLKVRCYLKKLTSRSSHGSYPLFSAVFVTYTEILYGRPSVQFETIFSYTGE